MADYEPLSEEKLRELEAIVAASEARKTRAASRVKPEDGRTYSYFGLVGFKTDAGVLDIGIGRLEPVPEPPGMMELAGALRHEQSGLFGAIGRYSPHVSHELAVLHHKESAGFARNAAWLFVAALRVRTLSEFLVPLVATSSWSTMAGLRDQSCSFQLVEDNPRFSPIGPSMVIAEADLRWVVSRLSAFASLCATPCFMLAVESLSSNVHGGSARMFAASLWSGIEALFGVQQELSFRIALYVAAFVEPRGQGRFELYRHVKKLYGARSKAVHGAKMTDAELREHICDARKVLSRILCAVIDQGRLLTTDEIERLLLVS